MRGHRAVAMEDDLGAVARGIEAADQEQRRHQVAADHVADEGKDDEAGHAAAAGSGRPSPSSPLAARWASLIHDITLAPSRASSAMRA